MHLHKITRIDKSIGTGSSCWWLEGERNGELFLMNVRFLWDTENAPKLYSGNNSMNTLKAVELYN